MRARIWTKAFVIIPALCLAGISAAAPQQGSSQQTSDPVADAATKAQAAGSATKAGDAAKAGDESKTEDPNGEAAWRKRFQAQRGKIAKAERELDILSRELEKAQLEYYPDPQKAMTQQNTRADINDKTAKIDAKKKQLDDLKQGLNDLEDQLRKAGGDPGWAR